MQVVEERKRPVIFDPRTPPADFPPDLWERYGPLITFLETSRGYGNFLVMLHGKRPVSVAQLGRTTSLLPQP